MRLIGKERLIRLCGRGEGIEKWIREWISEVLAAHWKHPIDVKDQFPNALQTGEDHFTFPIANCNCAVCLQIAFPQGIALITDTDLKAEDENY